MQGDTSPIKDILYSEIGKIGEGEIQRRIAKDSAGLISEILHDCIPKIDALQGDKDENFCGFAESLLHYLLTNALVPSQRKVAVRGVEVDVVIPDVRTLLSHPENAVIIHFARSRNGLAERLAALGGIQPVSGNIWAVTRNMRIDGHRTYQMADGAGFENILGDASEFTSSAPQSKFRIFKIGS